MPVRRESTYLAVSGAAFAHMLEGLVAPAMAVVLAAVVVATAATLATVAMFAAVRVRFLSMA